MRSDTQKKIFQVLKTVNEYKALITIGIIIYQTIFLVCYTTKEGIPFPTDFSTLSLLFLSLINFFIALLVGSIFFMPMLLNGDVFKNFYYYKKINSRENIYTFTKLSGFYFILYLSILTFDEVVDFIELQSHVIILLIFLLCIFSAWVAMKIKTKNRKMKFSDLKYGAPIAGINFIMIVFWIWIVSSLFSISFSDSNNDDLILKIIMYGAVIFAIFSFGYILTFPKQSNRQQLKKIITFSIIILYLLCSNLWLFNQSLKICKLGRFEAIYCFKEGDERFPDVLKAKNNRTIQLFVVLKTGNKIYAKENEKSKMIYEIDITGLTTIHQLKDKKKSG